MREVKRLIAYWKLAPPPHVALVQLLDVVITAAGGDPPDRSGKPVEYTSAAEWAALAVSLGR